MTLSRSEAVVELLSELVACPSVNATRHGTTEPPFGEGRIAELLRRHLEEMGAQVKVEEVMPGRPNVVAFFEGKNPERSLMLEAHSDVVPVEGMKIAPFDPRVEDGKLYGRGACDTKGPMTAMLLAVKEVLEQDGQPSPNLYFVSTCDEEHGARGARKLTADGLRVDAAIVGEPTGLTIANIHKGALRWRLSTKGKAAHSSVPEEGVNAVYHMARALEVITGTMIERLKEKRHPQLGHPTLSVGTIRGGSQVNIVPAECVIEIDRRMLPSEDRAELQRELVGEMEALREIVPDFEFRIEEFEYYPPFHRERGSSIMRRLRAACESCLGSAEFVAAPYATNAGIFEEAGIPCAVFGPGSAEQAHKDKEFIELKQVAQAVDVYAECIRAFDRAEEKE